MVPFPPAIYNGRKHLVEQPCQEIIENQQYELFGVDGHYTYYGTYRCIKVAAMDWSVLNSLDQKVSAWLFCSCKIRLPNETTSLRAPS